MGSGISLSGPAGYETCTFEGRRAFVTTYEPLTWEGVSYTVYVVGMYFPDDITVIKERPVSDIAEIVMHHDAVAFSGKDTDFDGTTLDESLERLSAIYNWHTNLDGMRQAGASSWGGIGYHAVIDRLGRIFVTRPDVFNTARAHVAGYDPARGNKKLNDLTVGICFMGNFADRKHDVTGAATPASLDVPTKAALGAFNALAQFVANATGREMELHPHSWYARYPGQSAKPCPGDWVKPDAWSGSTDFRYRPAAPPEQVPVLSEEDRQDLDNLQAQLTHIKLRAAAAIDEIILVNALAREAEEALRRLVARHT